MNNIYERIFSTWRLGKSPPYYRDKYCDTEKCEHRFPTLQKQISSIVKTVLIVKISHQPVENFDVFYPAIIYTRNTTSNNKKEILIEEIKILL